MNRLLFIINPVAGTRSKKDIPDLISKSLKNGIKYDYVFTNYAGHAKEIVKDNLENYDVFIAVGGDGTVNEVASAIINTSGILGIIPLGSGNGLARHLGIPLGLDSGIKQFSSEGKVETIDTCLVNSQTYLMTSGVGFEAKLTEVFTKDKGRGLYTYIRAGISSILSHKSNSYELEIDGKAVRRKAFTLSIANSSQYGNNTFINPMSDIQDGLLDVCILKPFPKRFSVDILRKIFTRKLHESRYYEFIRAKKVVIKSDVLNYHFDGEFVENNKRLEFEINPSSLKVLVPNHL